MAAQPLVSIVVINHNGAAIIGRCIEHLRSQNYPNVQIVAVDNGSSDDSIRILDHYADAGVLDLVRNATNLGVAAGRNAGIAASRGDIVAFIDDDACASPAWLSEAVAVLAANARVGAVAALVFFNRHKLLLNGAGGTLNRRGYGGDLCFREPYEFAKLPHHALYPMGCGMVVRRQILTAMECFDPELFNYYDDVEVGLWAWRLGMEVVVAPAAWIDHDFGSSDAFNRNKILLCERHRIRTVLKYFPTSHLPRWLLHEIASLVPRKHHPDVAVPYRAWSWNLTRLGSALRRRRRFRDAGTGDSWSMIHPSWGTFPPPHPDCHLNRPDPSNAPIILAADVAPAAFNYGWYAIEGAADPWRWTTAAASAYLRAPERLSHLAVRWRAAASDQTATLRLRRIDRPDVVWSTVDTPPLEWADRFYPCSAADGVYELQVLTTPPHTDIGQRELGVAIRRIGFEMRLP